MVNLRLDGIDGIAARLREINARKAPRILAQSVDRGSRSARAEIVRDLRSEVPSIPRSELLERITIRRGYEPAQVIMRLTGAGKHGRGFLRPRHLGLPLRRGAPVTWSADGQAEAPSRAFVVSPLGGSKPASNAKDGRAGRNFAPVGTGGFQRRKALVFQRVGSDRLPIRRINEPFTVGMLMQRGSRLERARRTIHDRITAEATRRLEVELKQ